MNRGRLGGKTFTSSHPTPPISQNKGKTETKSATLNKTVVIDGRENLTNRSLLPRWLLFHGLIVVEIRRVC